MAIDFKQRISGARRWNTSPVSTATDQLTPLAVFESDRGRIINSAAVRRLQQKTQVFPLERNAAVRSRLTHSMEVQQVGRHISQTIIKKLTDEGLLQEYGLAGLERQFESIVDMSCLMHDIGNPPFGHFGEAAINQWCDGNIGVLFDRACITDDQEHLTPLRRDLCSFEGNAQGLRIVDTLQALNLTYSQLSGLLKYTRRGDQQKPKNSYLQKKVGFYLSEIALLRGVGDALNMAAGRRSPFAYVMEAADDISYCIADIEDAVEKGILKIDELSGLLNREYEDLFCGNKALTKDGVTFASPDHADWMKKITSQALASYRKSELEGNFFVSLRVGINTKAVEHAASRFVDNISDIFSGCYDQALVEDLSANHVLLQTLKNIAVEHVFNHPEVEAQELQGYRIITGLLDIYKPLLTLDRSTFEAMFSGQYKTPLYETRLFKKLPGKHLKAYASAIVTLDGFKRLLDEPELQILSDNAWELYFRCRLILDYISGMTDQFALDEYRALHVID
ncbi:dGTPase [Thalassolituus hydrocarboniclasticus]|uniref:Probable deoxyguanosinetriphosphate triphosphohydrolase n=1 Tax=Thalassolituus hydrocarboniclasticus TaxID=2742796 RepID=A0ABY6ABJ9_9GAMM|nr:dGTPase [Thalassolituus hydrocarboniclasticus]UXD87339.1 dGTPase [Thalassolituus hydrocarboniclasticus]